MTSLPLPAFLLHIALLAQADGLGPPKDVAFTADVDGTSQRYVEMLPTDFDPAAEHHVLMAFHGHGSDRWQFVRQTRGTGREARRVAAKYGMIFVAPDYRAKTSWMGPKAEADVLQIIRELRARHRVGKVFLVGGSMGGSSVLTFAALHPDLVAGVCSCNGTANHLEYERFQPAIQASFGGTKDEIPLEYKRRRAEYWPEAFTMPVAITAGGKDRSVPPGSVLRLAHVLKQMKRDVLLIYRPDGGHSTKPADSAAALEFVVRRALGLAPAEPPPGEVEGGGILFAGLKPESCSATGHVELGLRLEATKAGAIHGVWLYQAEGETGPHVFRVWTAEGRLVHQTDPSEPRTPGWHRTPLAPPVEVKAGETFVVSYTANARYVATAGIFKQPIVKPGITGHAGLYSFDALGQMPTKTYKQMSYFLDVDYVPAR